MTKKPNAPDDPADQRTNKVLKMLEQLSAREHRFWNTQPVPQTPEQVQSVSEQGPFEENKPASQIRTDAIRLPPEFEWSTVDVENGLELQELYELLNENYVEDYDSMFRFDYSPSFLRWALMPPGWQSEWHVGVRVASSRKLVAFIAATPVDFMIRDANVPAVEVNFLCVHKRLRNKRMTPVLIKEATRRVHLHGIFQALYTAGTMLPEPIAKARYYHRPLNYRTLVETCFASIPPGKTLEQMALHFYLPKVR